MSYRNKNAERQKLLKLQTVHREIKYMKYPKNVNSIMELGAGKLNDLDNWEKAKIKKVYAIEIDKKSVEIGYKKYNNFVQKYKHKHYPEIVYMVADLTKKRNINRLIDKLDPNEKLRHSIDHVVCNFAIHYFLKNDETFSNVVGLIKHFLKIGGTFRFTTMNGGLIYNKLKKSKDGSIKLMKNNKKLYFKISRKYGNKTKFKKFGQKISVFILSIGKSHDEYLVNFKYIIDKLKKNGFKLSEYIDFSKLIDIVYRKNKKIKKMDIFEYKWSIMNSYLEFKRIVSL